MSLSRSYMLDQRNGRYQRFTVKAYFRTNVIIKAACVLLSESEGEKMLDIHTR